MNRESWEHIILALLGVFILIALFIAANVEKLP